MPMTHHQMAALQIPRASGLLAPSLSCELPVRSRLRELGRQLRRLELDAFKSRDHTHCHPPRPHKRLSGSFVGRLGI